MATKPKSPHQEQPKTAPPADEGRFRDDTDVAVDAIHQRIVGREQTEPEEGFEPPPVWVWAASVVLLFVMGFYLGRYSGSWSTVAHEVESPAAAAAGPVKRTVNGTVVFTGVCQTCHQTDGNGVAGQYPPLAGSEWVTRDAATPIRIVLYGLEGPITVKQTAFNNKMTPFHDKLTDDEIAAVVTHIRSSWRNSASAVTAEEVADLRAKYGVRGSWSAAELSAERSAR